MFPRGSCRRAAARAIAAAALLLACACACACGDEADPPAGSGDGGGAGVAPHAWVARRSPLDPDAPWLLSETGLYADFAGRTLAPGVGEFQPAYALWSDGADKRRFIELPPGAAIDTSDVDRWQFPIGTRVWKEFSRGGVPLETRLIERTGPSKEDYFMGAFVWRPDGSDAELRREGVENVAGTDHDVPARKACWACHGGEPGRILGFSALQLSGAPGRPTLDELVANGRLSAPPPADAPRGAPGDAATSGVLGYLHANCGHCHSPSGLARPETDIVLRLSVAERTPAETALYRSSLEVPLQKFRSPEVSLRVAPGRPDASGLLVRMRQRVKDVSMPPIGTKHVDAAASALVEAWIRGL